jgi:hypothetical protein
LFLSDTVRRQLQQSNGTIHKKLEKQKQNIGNGSEPLYQGEERIALRISVQAYATAPTQYMCDEQQIFTTHRVRPP